MTAVMRAADPYWKRPIVFDKQLKKKRRLFWDELSPEQRTLEFRYHEINNQPQRRIL